MKLLVLMGLTGVGKSTAVGALQASGTAFTLLPNRRALTDDLIIPEMQRAAGTPPEPVTDRLERFELTRRYREQYPGGMAHALSAYLEAQPPVGEASVVFDNLRGLDEARAAAEAFPEARFIMLDAPPIVRLQRLVGRADDFDSVASAGDASTLHESLAGLDSLHNVFESEALLRLEAGGIPGEALLKGVRIILSEAQNYDMDAAAAYLRGIKDARAFLYLQTADLSREAVRAQIGAWL